MTGEKIKKITTADREKYHLGTGDGGKDDND